MKLSKVFLLLLTGIALLSGCGLHTTVVGNLNNQVTNVELSQNNFKVIDKVSGQSTATYIFGIGGLSNKALIEKAKSQMLESANLVGNARAIVNLTTEDHITLVFPVFYRRTVNVSGHVIEFQ